MPQVKTPEAGACAVFRISLGFKQLARGLHVFFRMTAVYAALLAAIAVIRIRLPLEVRIVLAWISAA
jgi:hypothetical protein